MSKHTQHTPAPWKQYQWEDKIYASVRGPDGRCVADCGSRSDQIAQANARLIAAAPDLLEALRYIAGLDTSQDASPAQCSAVAVAMDAIAKAEGGAS